MVTRLLKTSLKQRLQSYLNRYGCVAFMLGTLSNAGKSTSLLSLSGHAQQLCYSTDDLAVPVQVATI